MPTDDLFPVPLGPRVPLDRVVFPTPVGLMVDPPPRLLAEFFRRPHTGVRTIEAAQWLEAEGVGDLPLTGGAVSIAANNLHCVRLEVASVAQADAALSSNPEIDAVVYLSDGVEFVRVRGADDLLLRKINSDCRLHRLDSGRSSADLPRRREIASYGSELRDLRDRLRRAGYPVGVAEASRLIESIRPSAPLHHLVRGLQEVRDKASPAHAGQRPVQRLPGHDGRYSSDFQMHEPYDNGSKYLGKAG